MKISRRTIKRNLTGYLFISPWIVGMLAFTVFPVIFSAFISFTDWSLLKAPSFIGWDNFKRMFADRIFYHSLGVTAQYTLMTLLPSLGLSLCVAAMLNTQIRMRGFFRVAYYLPAVLPSVAVALVWAFLYNPNYGLINNVLRTIGVQGPKWLSDTKSALPAIAIMGVWGGCSGNIIMYLSGLQGVPRSYYEAAVIDGASSVKKFFYITLPMISPILFFTLIMGIIGSFQVFSSAMILTKGGPVRATTFYVLYLYNNAFTYFEMGYASALAWMLFLLILVLNAVVFVTSSRWVYYEGGEKNG